MFVADFHIHSKHSMATSKECLPEILELWARRKGVQLLGTGDFTHPLWREELREKLLPAEEGLYTLRENFRLEDDSVRGKIRPRFIISGEISSIYKKGGKVRKVHNLILLPSLEEAESLSCRLESLGNLHSDGRPILGLDSKDLLAIVLEICPRALFIPAHIWTPHFSLFGAKSGFDGIRECFGDLTEYIYALETGLSSDPSMNWRLSTLDNLALISNSDAHSPTSLAREANVFDTDLSYTGIFEALKNNDLQKFCGTIEFFPEEGKYHHDGHRSCQICWKPAQTKAASGICPICGKTVTMGVLHRIETLADRPEGYRPEKARPFENLIPLQDIITTSMGYKTTGIKVRRKYLDMVTNLGTELAILREIPVKEIEEYGEKQIAESINRMRKGEIIIKPGSDGQYGEILVK